MANEKSEIFSIRLGSEQGAMAALTMILSMDWRGFIWNAKDGRHTLLMTGYDKQKETPGDESRLLFSENLDNLGEQLWTSPL